MEKLEPILKQKFWIILGVGLILTIIGWWQTTGSLAATIKTRRDEIDAARKSIPGGENPNDTWTQKLAAINAVQKTKVEDAGRELWLRQKKRMFWPPNIVQFVEKVKFREDLPLDAAELYRSDYDSDVEKVWKVVVPFNRFDGSGIVEFPIEKLPQTNWVDRQSPPTSKQMWDSQEDLWLLEPILEAVRNVNGGETTNRVNAYVHVIERLQLMGGKRGEPVSGSGGGSPEGGGDMPMGDGYPGAPGEGGMGGFGGGFGGGAAGGFGAGAQTAASADFDPKEEFGSDGSAGAGGFGGGFGAAMGGSADTPVDGEEAPTADTQAAAGGVEARRYVDDAEANLPYITRGFYLTVLMDHRQVPNLIGQLTANGNSDWPIEVLRVQMVRLNPDEHEGRSGGPGGMMAGMGSGSGMGMPPGMGGGGGFPGASGGFPGASGASGEDVAGGFVEPDTGASGNFGPPGGFPGAGGLGVMGGSRKRRGFDPEKQPVDPVAAQAGMQSLMTALQDPFISRVALCGLIYIYKPVEPPAETPSEGTPAEGMPPVAETAPADGTMPAETESATVDGATPADPAVVTTEPAVTETPTTDPPATTEPLEPTKPDDAPVENPEPKAPATSSEPPPES